MVCNFGMTKVSILDRFCFTKDRSSEMQFSESIDDRSVVPDKASKTTSDLTLDIRLVAFAAIFRKKFLTHSSDAMKTGARTGLEVVEAVRK
jgi:hypothetical protein